MSVIDSLEFARTGQTLRGTLPIPGLARLRDGLYDDAGEVAFAVRGGHDARQRPILMLDISGVLRLRCQRCLGVLDYPLRLINTLLLLEQAEIASPELDQEQVEWVEASPALDVSGLIEDEILLSLPYSPRHDEGRCRQASGAAANDVKISAFSALAALKKDSH